MECFRLWHGLFLWTPGMTCNEVDLYMYFGYNNDLNVHVLWFSFDLR